MNFSKSTRIITTVILSFSMIALAIGCSVETTKYAGQTLTVKVTSFDGTTVTAELGELTEATADGMLNGISVPQNSVPETSGMPSDSVPAMTSDTSVPQVPSGFDIPSDVSVPENGNWDPTLGASGNKQFGDYFTPGIQSGSSATFTSSGETVTFLLTDDTAIISESSGSAAFSSTSEITIGTVLQVRFDSAGTVIAVIVKSITGSI
ncbi:MAG TPA: hypothetical protein PK629_11850 [Oscillospiraceae bacterium]|nr:hypothetical protein [Oscillospiraceae bacterium]HPF55117.1 hypothetical protein [Clostridiales bacterium]HPK34565.1 hypothetical protein [Oscillospiraceae bacterium]HPR74793.1 hypothetical protein [Oscillospiraceae bacterium]